MSVHLRTDFRAIECGGCGIVFGMTQKTYERFNEHRRSFCCPNGCERHFVGMTDIERAQEAQKKAEGIAAAERDRHARTKRELEHTEARRRGEKAAKTRLKKRIKGGVCPCCKRSFVQLTRHMATKHPEYAEDEG